MEEYASESRDGAPIRFDGMTLTEARGLEGRGRNARDGAPKVEMGEITQGKERAMRMAWKVSKHKSE